MLQPAREHCHQACTPHTSDPIRRAATHAAHSSVWQPQAASHLHHQCTRCAPRSNSGWPRPQQPTNIPRPASSCAQPGTHSNCTLRDPYTLQKNTASEAVLQILSHWAANASPSPQGLENNSTKALHSSPRVDARRTHVHNEHTQTNEMRKQCPHPRADMDNTWQRPPSQYQGKTWGFAAKGKEGMEWRPRPPLPKRGCNKCRWGKLRCVGGGGKKAVRTSGDPLCPRGPQSAATSGQSQ